MQVLYPKEIEIKKICPSPAPSFPERKKKKEKTVTYLDRGKK
jgi:hypothetical protein